MSTRCPWLDESKNDYVHYHDHEWGVPVLDDKKMFEFLTLESAQAGLSWYTILRRREGYRALFADFDANKVAEFTENDQNRLLQDTRIIRNRLKVSAAISNARQFLQVQREFGSFCQYLWGFVDGRVQVSSVNEIGDYRATSTLSDTVSRDLKQRGFKFVGSTIVYAHLQAAGLINDHANHCFRKQEIIDSYASLGLDWQAC